MERFKGFVPVAKDSTTKRAAMALVWLLKRSPDESKAFASWTELYAAVTGKKAASVDPTEVKEQLRSRGGQVKLLMREMGYGWLCHEADRGLIRACAHGADSGPCVQRYIRRASRANENVITWADKTMGNLKDIIRTKTNREMLDGIQLAVAEIRDLRLGLDDVPVVKATEAKRRAA